MILDDPLLRWAYEGEAGEPPITSRWLMSMTPLERFGWWVARAFGPPTRIRIAVGLYEHVYGRRPQTPEATL
ncbi:MAG: hypothetical protein QM692_21100 [Thermomicrobiales bacterium]